MSVHSSSAPREPSQLYDARRDRHYSKPRLRGWMHLIAFELSLVVGTLMLASAHGPLRLTATAIYVTSVAALFGVSALYHRGTWTAAASVRMQRLDHTMILVLIAGTATPAFLISAGNAYGFACLAGLWALTLTAVLSRLLWMKAPEMLAGATYLGLGWLGVLALPPVWIDSGVLPAALIVTGGLLYTAGAISFHRRSPDPRPLVFGYHEVFHAYVSAAAVCHYVANAIIILS